MKVLIPIKCPGCEIKTKVKILKPGFMDKRIAYFICEGCESGITAIISKSKPGPDIPKNEVEIKVRVSQPSPLLVEMLKEEQEFKNIVQTKMVDVHGREIRA